MGEHTSQTPATIPAQVAAALPMPLHRVVVEDDWLTARFECDAPVGSKCRLTCAVNCGAEEWPCGTWNDDVDELEQHAMADSGECHVLLFLDNTDGARDDADRTGLIEVTWEGDFYSWVYAPLSAKGSTDA